MSPKYAFTTKGERIPTIYGVWTGEDYRPSGRRIFLSRHWSSYFYAAKQFQSDASLEAMDRRAPNNSKIGSGWQKVTSPCDGRHLLRMAINEPTASSWQLAASWSNDRGVLMLDSSIDRRLLHRVLRARMPLHRISLTANHRGLRFCNHSRAQSLASWFRLCCLFRCIRFRFVEPWWLHSC